MRVGPTPGAGAGRAGDGVGRGHEGIGAVVDVQHRPLGALEQHALPVAQRLVDDERGVGDEGPQALGVVEQVARRPPRPRGAAGRRASRGSRSWPRARPRACARGSWGRAGPGRGCRRGRPCPRSRGRCRGRWCRSRSAPRRFSDAPSSITWYGMIRCALPLRRRRLERDPALLEAVDLLAERGRGRRPRRCRSRRACPGRGSPRGSGAACRPRRRPRSCARRCCRPGSGRPRRVRSASRSTTLPLPSSPHWAPMTTVAGTAGPLARLSNFA